jgi:uncharacterized protein YraI
MGLGQPPGHQPGSVDATQPGGRRLPIRLRVQLGTQIGRTYTMSGDVLTIGRAPDNDLVLDDPQASRYHARLIRRGDEVLVEDLGSTNGTLVSGRRIGDPHALQPTETIAVGGTVLSIEGYAAPDTLGMVPVGALRARQAAPPAEAIPTDKPRGGSSTPWMVIAGLAGLLIVVVLILALGGMLSWLLSSQTTPAAPSVPSIFVQSPVAGSEVIVNQPLEVSAVASDVSGISRVEMRVAGVVVAQWQATERPSPTTRQVILSWTPTAQGGYTLELKAYNVLGVVSEPTALLVIAVPEPGATSTATATPEPTPTASGPVALTTADLNIREGPGQDYPVLGVVPAGTELQILGKNPEVTWWQVAYPRDGDGRGWVFVNFTSSRNTEDVPVVVTPVAPTPTPTATPTETPVPTPTNTRVVKPSPTPTPVPTPVPITGPLVELAATRSSIVPGECVTLQWHIERIKAAFLTGGEFDNVGVTGPYGSWDTCPLATTTFTLRAETDAGVVERTVTVEVATAQSNEQSVTVYAAAVAVNSEGSAIQEPLAGDDGSDHGMRVLLTFDLDPLRSVSDGTAYLDLSSYQLIGDPFAELGALYVEEIESDGAPNRDSYAQDATARLAKIDSPAGLSQPMDVTERVVRYVATGRLAYVVRLRFRNETDQDDLDEYVRWSSARIVVYVHR